MARMPARAGGRAVGQPRIRLLQRLPPPTKGLKDVHADEGFEVAGAEEAGLGRGRRPSAVRTQVSGLHELMRVNEGPQGVLWVTEGQEWL